MDIPLKIKFSRLYHWDLDKNASVRDRVEWSDLGFDLRWNWRSNPNGRARGEVADITSRLSAYIKRDRLSDSWQWKLSNNDQFTTKDLTKLIELDGSVLGNSQLHQQETLRNNFVPLKVEVFIWRLLRQRLPVRVELDKRGIDLNSLLCPLCDDDIESITHTIFFCKYAMGVWERVYKWWGFGGVTNLSLSRALI
ncbi:uncharacterized protein [Rutidosis leptorrhynchoides]|uniref:uncharacterized protein n=1 Tax=Rutidosis leptorrhynchoides TaxID=125765 RepID=UPI003A990869